MTLSEFNEGEKIFGADIDYDVDITATIIKLDNKVQRSWKGFSVGTTLQALGLTFTGTPTLLSLKPAIGYIGDADYLIKKHDTYNGIFEYTDEVNETGKFKGIFYFTMAEMIAMRRYIATQRGNTISIPAINGVPYPFGRRVTSYPISCKIIDWDDKGMVSYGVSSSIRCWKMEITFSEIV